MLILTKELPKDLGYPKKWESKYMCFQHLAWFTSQHSHIRHAFSSSSTLLSLPRNSVGILPKDLSLYLSLG